MRKRMSSNNAFQFDIVYKDTKRSQNELPEHIHDWYELVYVYHGKGTFFIDQKLYDMQPGDLFLIPGNTIHRAIPDADNPVTSTAAFFHPLFLRYSYPADSFSIMGCYERCRQTKNYRLKSSDLSFRPDDRLDSMYREIKTGEPGFRQAVALELQFVLLQLSRHLTTDSTREGAVSAFGPRWLLSALDYIDDHIAEPLRIDTLCRQAAVSSAHYSREFKKYTGINVTDYIVTKRVILAKEMLSATNHTIALIAELSGFESLPYFHRTFKKNTGMTPAAFRKSGSEWNGHQSTTPVHTLKRPPSYSRTST
ncbi:helix-turn-helix domain-containing protein [Paenibacillus tarimensis]